jgi:hypothetical protein
MAKPKIGIRPGGKYAEGDVPENEPKDGTTSTVKDTLAPVVSAVTDNSGLTGKAVTSMQARNKANEEALNLARGVARLVGPGTTTSDSIPVHLSEGEAVLPANTVKAVGADNVEKLIETTNGKPKVGIGAGGKFAVGEVPASGAYQAGQKVGGAIGDVASSVGEAASTATKLSTLPIRALGAGIGAATDTGTQFARGAFGMSPTGVPANIEGIAPITPEEHARAAASAAQAKSDAAPAVTTPAVPTVSAATTPAIGVNRPAPAVGAAPTQELPKFGTTGTGYVRNEQTGATQVFTPPPVKPIAPVVTPFKNTAGYDPQLDRIAATNAATVANLQSEAGLHGAQTAETQQKAEQQAHALEIQKEMAGPDITPKRKAQLAEILHGLRGAGDIWMPYQAKDAMGMPTGESLMYNRATGETKPIGTPAAPAPNAVPNTGETRGGYKFKGGNPNDKANWEKV